MGWTSSCLLVLLVTASAIAKPRIAGTGDAEGDAVRAAAVMVIQKIAEGDAAGALAEFHGTADDGKLLEADLRLVTASKALQQAVMRKFGGVEDLDEVVCDRIVQAWANQIPSRIVIVSGDWAGVSEGFFLQSGVLLHKSEGRWQVVGLALRSGPRDSLEKFASEAAGKLDHLRHGVSDGSLASVAAVKKECEATVGASFLAWSRAQGWPGESTPPEPKPLGMSLSGEQLTGLIGQKVSSDLFQSLVGSMPGLPRVYQSRDAFWLNSDAAGLEVQCRTTVPTVRLVTVYVREAHGFAGYTGELPFGLRSSDRRRDVERKLGRPMESSGGDGWSYRAIYRKLGLDIEYDTKSARDGDGQIQTLTLRTGDPQAAKAEQDGKAPVHNRLSLRLVDFTAPGKDVERLVDLDAGNGATLPVSQKPILVESDFQNVQPIPSPFSQGSELRWDIGLKFTVEGTERLRAALENRPEARIALVLDGQIVTAPLLKAKVQQEMSISSHLTEEQTFRLVQRMHAAVFTLEEKRGSEK